MAIGIASNIASMRATNDMSKVASDSALRRDRLASGLTINSSREGSAQLSTSEGMRAEIGGLTQGTRNTEHALDLLRIAEGGMNEISAILIRMREMAVQSSSATLNDNDRESLDAEFGQIKETIDRIVGLANYNEQSLLRGFGNAVNTNLSTALTNEANTGVRRIEVSAAKAGDYIFMDNGGDNEITLGNGVTTQTVNLGSRTVDGAIATGTTQIVNFDRLGVKITLAGADVAAAPGSYQDGQLDGKTIVIEDGIGGSFQLGSDTHPADRLEYDIPDISTDGRIVDLAHVGIGTRDSARAALSKLDLAINRLNNVRGEVSAISNRLTHTMEFTANAIELVNASESTVRSTDFAWESSHLARNEILRRSATSVFSMSQVSTDIAMSLLQF